MSHDSTKRLVRCPNCGQDAIYAAENPFRPFCSKRCRLIDLGEWVEGNFRIAGSEADPMALLENFEIDENEPPH